MNNLKAKLKKQGGFTLIEMLIVVAIIAILVAIAIPTVGSVLDNAKKAADDANERAAKGVAMVEVLAENKLGGEELTGTTMTAYYEIDKGEGKLVSTKPAEGINGTFGYGKQKDNVNKGIVITYTLPTATEAGKFETSWAQGTTS